MKMIIKLKQKIRLKFLKWLGIPNISKEIQYNLLHIQALETYIQKRFDLDSYVFEKCIQHNITDSSKFHKLKENRKRKLYYDYHNKHMKGLVKNNFEEIKFFS